MYFSETNCARLACLIIPFGSTQFLDPEIMITDVSHASSVVTVCPLVF